MNAFFSGTDWENLHDRGIISNYFLMLIVNFDGKYCAKVAFKAKQEGKNDVSLEFCNNSDGYSALKLKGKNDKEVLVVMDCKIVYPEAGNVDEGFIKRWENVKKSIEEEKTKKTAIVSTGQPKLPFRGEWYEGVNAEDWVSEAGIYRKKDKKISEMTQREWEEQERKSLNLFDIRHAKCFLNACLDDKFDGTDFSDPINKLEKIDRKLKTYIDRQNFIQDLQFVFPEKFDVVFPYKTEADYSDLMEVVYDFLNKPSYLTNKLVKDVVDVVREEIHLTGNKIV